MKYNEVYAALANRAVEQGIVDIESLAKQLAALGTSPQRIEEMLIEDLETDGPIFGKFFRSLGAAAQSSVSAVAHQSLTIGEVLAAKSPADMTKMFGETWDKNAIRDALEDADPEVMEELENSADEEMFRWVAALENTCFRCLPLHNIVLSKRQWRESGYDPRTIHADWSSKCYCKLIMAVNAESFAELKDPLVRNKDIEGIRGAKKTLRGLTQADIERSIVARNKAMESEEGRKIIRILGQSNKTE